MNSECVSVEEGKGQGQEAWKQWQARSSSIGQQIAGDTGMDSINGVRNLLESSPGVALELLLGRGITAVGGCGRHGCCSSKSARERRMMEVRCCAFVE